MYSGEARTILFCAVSRGEVHQLKSIIHEADPAAFVVIGQAHEALGLVAMVRKKNDQAIVEQLDGYGHYTMAEAVIALAEDRSGIVLEYRRVHAPVHQQLLAHAPGCAVPRLDPSLPEIQPIAAGQASALAGASDQLGDQVGDGGGSLGAADTDNGDAAGPCIGKQVIDDGAGKSQAGVAVTPTFARTPTSQTRRAACRVGRPATPI